MNKQDNLKPENHQPLIEDLTINEVQSTAIKGGPIYLKVDGIDGYVTNRS